VTGASIDESKAIAIAEKFLDAVGIAHARDLLPDEISGGMQKRLGIARALALDPQIVFYDDPTAGLDPITSRKIVQLILELRDKRKSTVVAVTNDMHRAYQLADRIMMVVDKEVIDCGSPAQTQCHKDPRVAQFIRGLLDGPLTVQA
jgi:phospholipid/cholesterol/gamma-HCH transport system ATP-binding protein